MKLALVAFGLVAMGCAARAPMAPGHRAPSSAKQDTGGDGVAARTACTEPADCTLIEARCACGELHAEDVDAVSSTWLLAHPTAPPGCDCLVEPSPSLYPICRGGRCRVLDVATSTLSRCTTAADCIAIDPACCPPCGPNWHMVAVASRRAGRLRSQVCGADWEMTTCPACASPPMPTPALACDHGHCRIETP